VAATVAPAQVLSDATLMLDPAIHTVFPVTPHW
jgi:hypothetical protein